MPPPGSYTTDKFRFEGYDLYFTAGGLRWSSAWIIKDGAPQNVRPVCTWPFLLPPPPPPPFFFFFFFFFF